MDFRYRLVLFDCFNTLFFVDESRLPRIEIEGRPTTSTAGFLVAHLRQYLPTVTDAEVHHAHRAAWRWAEAQRGEDCREIPAVSRFGRMTSALGIEPLPEATLEHLVSVHIAAVLRSYRLPGAHRELLDRLGRRMRLAMLSNFDYGPGMRDLLRRTGIEGHFDPLAISAEIGYRKPGRAAFEHVLSAAGVPAAEVLFVGDSATDDVQGARLAGLDVAWLNRDGAHPAPDPAPTYTLTDLTQLDDLLDSSP